MCPVLRLEHAGVHNMAGEHSAWVRTINLPPCHLNLSRSWVFEVADLSIGFRLVLALAIAHPCRSL